MSCFVQKQVDNPKFPNLSRRVAEIKSTEGGVSEMCELMEKYIAEGKAEARAEGRLEQLIDLVKKSIITVTQAAQEANMSEDSFKVLLTK